MGIVKMILNYYYILVYIYVDYLLEVLFGNKVKY